MIRTIITTAILISIGIGLFGLIGGCGEDDGDTSMPEVSPDQPQAAAEQSGEAAKPPTVDPGTVSIDEQTYLLPPAVLVAEPIDAGMRLQLTGSEAPEDQTGNTLLLNMQVPAETLADLPDNPWIFRTTEDTWTDTPQGLSIEEEGWVLRPFEVTVEIVPESEQSRVATIRLSGTFVLFDLSSPPDAPGRRVQVSGQFPAGIVFRAAGQ